MFKAWILDIKEKHEKDKVVPGMEPTGHYWFNLGKFLQDNEMKPVLVNPHHVKKSKELDDNNPTKNDRKDPKVIAGLVKEERYMISLFRSDTVPCSFNQGLRPLFSNCSYFCISPDLVHSLNMSLVGKNPEFGTLHHYYTTRKINPLKKMQSLMAVAAKLIRVLYAMRTIFN